MRSRILASLLLALIPAASCVAGVTPIVNFQGRLTTPTGAAVPDTNTQTVTFRLYGHAQGGPSLWQQVSTAVSVQRGLFTAPLDFSVGYTAGSSMSSVFTGDAIYIEVQVSGDAPMTPRQLLSAVPTAFTAQEALSVSDGSITSAALAPNVIPTSLPPSGPASGDLAGVYPIPELATLSSSLAKVSGGTMSSVNGRIGIGTATPGGRLEVAGPPLVTTLIDQQQLLHKYGVGSVDNWQSFTCGRSGMLTSFDLRIGSPTYPSTSPCTLEIRSGEGVGGQLLSTQSVTLQPLIAMESFTLDSPAPVTAGQIYTIRFTVPAVTYGFVSVADDVYSGGRSDEGAQYDYTFDTYVTQTTETTPLQVADDGSVSLASLHLPGGSTGLVLTSDAVGAAAWQTPAAVTPIGPAGGNLTGTYPNPTIANLAVTDANIAGMAYAKLTGAPVSLPPSGVAGGDLTGSYPSPTIRALAVTNAKIADVAWSKVTGAPTTLPPSGTASGDLSGTYPGPTVAKLRGTAVSSTAPTANGQVLKYNSTTTQWEPGSVTTGTVTNVATGTGLTGGPITSSGTVAIATAGVTNTLLANDAASLNKVSGGVMTSAGGKVGIGATTPIQTLDVNGGISVSGGVIQKGGASAITATGDLGLYSEVANTWMRFVTNNGYFQFFSDSGIGTTPHMVLDAVGNLTVAGTVTANGATLTSDGRFKRNVRTVDNALATVLALRGVTFDWDRAAWPVKNFPEEPQIGFIAQEVEKVLPDVVHTDADGYKSVAYQNVVPVLVEAVKAQQAEISSKDAQIVSLQKQNASIEARLERLERLVTHSH